MLLCSGEVEKYIANMELPKELGWKSQKGSPNMEESQPKEHLKGTP